MNISKQILFLLITIFFISCTTRVEYLPKDFFGLRLTKKLTGKEANDFVNKLHLQQVTETENEIGFYEGDKGRALIYVTHYQNPEDTENDYNKMTEKISPRNSVFVGSEYIDINGKKIYRTFGMGQSHYVFYHNKELYWVSVDTHFGLKFVEEYINYIE
jgi:hypothetical protein